MKIGSLLKILFSSIFFIFLIGCYTKLKHNPPIDNSEEKELLYKKQKGRIVSELGISIDSSAHILYSIYSYSEFGRSSKTWIIDFDGRQKFYRSNNGKHTLINDFYLSPEELQEIQDLFYNYEFKQFPLNFPTNGNPKTIGGATYIAFREKKGSELLISKLDYRTIDDYRSQHAYHFISKIKIILSIK